MEAHADGNPGDFPATPGTPGTFTRDAAAAGQSGTHGKQAVVSPVEGSKLTAIFTADQVSGAAGCNDYSGGYTINGTTLKIGPLASTMRACADQAVSDQEQQFLAALQASTTYSQSGNILTLKAAGGENQVTLIPAK